MKDKISVLISEEDLKKRIAEMGEEISRDYAGKEIHMISVLRGGVFITTGLANCISVPVTIDFMSVSSYGNSISTSGNVLIKKDLEDDIAGKDVLVVEDIIDSGVTLSKLIPLLKQRNPASLRICTLLDKPERREAEIQVDYIGFQVPNKFVVGYGLDYQQRYRNLPYIGEVHCD